MIIRDVSRALRGPDSSQQVAVMRMAKKGLLENVEDFIKRESGTPLSKPTACLLRSKKSLRNAKPCLMWGSVTLSRFGSKRGYMKRI